MRSPSLSRIAVLSLTIALGAMPQTACHKKAQEAKGSDDKTTLAASRAEAEQSLERLRSQIGALRKALSEVHQRLDALPEDMPDLDAFRSKLFSVEEVFGVEDGRVKWLASKLNAALRAGSQQQAQVQVKEVSSAVHDAIDGNKGEIVVALSHQLMDLERRVYKHRLSTGYEIKAARGGIEQGLIDMIADTKTKVDRTTWFTFDRIAFETGDTTLDLSRSKLQLDNVVAILASFPAAKLEIGDFTDNSAPTVANEKLSAARAGSIKRALIALGVAPSRLEAHGYGARNPVCPANDTVDCKAMNRRIAARVTAK
jgi:outer membrane protein OmpA-like peptidoglycan-associated protein